MPWTDDDPPGVAKNWTKGQRHKCVAAANSVLKDTGDEQQAIFACIHAAGKSKKSKKSGSSMIYVGRLPEGFSSDGWVLLVPELPAGYWRDGARRVIDEPTLAAMAANWSRRTALGLVARLPINIEHDAKTGAIGWIEDVRVDDGFWIKPTWSDQGVEIVENQQFGYMSAEIWWDFEVPTTGEVVGPVLGGAAITNYPFFGEATAIYSRQVGAGLLELFQDEGDEEAERRRAGILLTIRDLMAAMDQVGWVEEDMRWLSDLVATPAPDLTPVQRALAAVLADIAGLLPGAYDRRALVEAFARVQREDGVAYPASAFLLSAGQPGGWRLRAKDLVGGRLQVSAGSLSRMARELAAGGGLGPEDRRLGQAALVQLYRKSGVPERGIPRHLFDTGGRTMDEDTERPGGAEEFAQLQARLVARDAEMAALTTEREAFAARVRELEVAAQAAEDARLTERFAREAEGFRAMGAANAELGAQLKWLWLADTAEGRPHFEWFATQLRGMDAALASGPGFHEVGSVGVDSTDPKAHFNSLVDTEVRGGLEYSEAVDRVARANPTLYNEAYGTKR